MANDGHLVFGPRRLAAFGLLETNFISHISGTIKIVFPELFTTLSIRFTKKLFDLPNQIKADLFFITALISGSFFTSNRSAYLVQQRFMVNTFSSRIIFIFLRRNDYFACFIG